MSEQPTPNTHRGRMDSYITELDDKNGLYATILEVKDTDWDCIKPKNVMRNLSSHRRQLWRYMEEPHDDFGIDTTMAVVYPRRPKRKGLIDEIEAYMEEHLIVVYGFYDK